MFYIYFSCLYMFSAIVEYHMYSRMEFLLELIYCTIGYSCMCILHVFKVKL